MTIIPVQTVVGKGAGNIFLLQNNSVLSDICDCLHLLELSKKITPCKGLVTGWLHYIGLKDASCHEIWGIIIGEGKACITTVFCLACPDYLKELFRKGNITNSDLEMTGLLMLWLVMEEVYPKLRASYVAFLSEKAPTIAWVKRRV